MKRSPPKFRLLRRSSPQILSSASLTANPTSNPLTASLPVGPAPNPTACLPLRRGLASAALSPSSYGGNVVRGLATPRSSPRSTSGALLRRSSPRPTPYHRLASPSGHPSRALRHHGPTTRRPVIRVTIPRGHLFASRGKICLVFGFFIEGCF
jgi:hypothetical protein